MLEQRIQRPPLPSTERRPGARSAFGAPVTAPQRPDSIEPPRGVSEPDPPLEWRAAAGSGMAIGVVLATILGLVAAFAIARALGESGTSRIIWVIVAGTSVPGAGYVVYLLRGLAGMRYVLGRRALAIECLATRRSVPYDAVLDIVYAPRERVPAAGWERYWPGFHISTSRMIDGVWHSWATQPPHRRVRIVTASDVIAISPQRPILFIDELNRRCGGVLDAPIVEDERVRDDDDAVPAIPETERVQDHPSLGYAWRVLFRERLLGDQVASALVAAGVVLPLLMAGYLYSQYEGVPTAIALHYNAHGQIDSIGEPRDLWMMPIVAAIVLALNTALATFAELFDRFVSRLFLVATPAVQLLAFIAMLRLMNSS